MFPEANLSPLSSMIANFRGGIIRIWPRMINSVLFSKHVLNVSSNTGVNLTRVYIIPYTHGHKIGIPYHTIKLFRAQEFFLSKYFLLLLGESTKHSLAGPNGSFGNFIFTAIIFTSKQKHAITNRFMIRVSDFTLTFLLRNIAPSRHSGMNDLMNQVWNYVINTITWLHQYKMKHMLSLHQIVIHYWGNIWLILY